MFTRAQRKKSKLRLALCGPSGSGKTYSSLMIAKGLGGKVALIDTEAGSADLYSHKFEYDTCQISRFSPDDYIKAIKEAETAGYDVLIIDSLSHAWSGTGGILDKVDKVSKSSRSGNSFGAWREVTPDHNKLVDTILQSSLNIIVTMRTKTAYDMQENSKGRLSPVKIGLAPIQKDGLEYEFTLVLDLSIDGHIATSSKDRTELFDGKYETISVETGEKIKCWLNQGVDVLEFAKAQADLLSRCKSLDECRDLFISASSSLKNDSKSLQILIDAKDEAKSRLTENVASNDEITKVSESETRNISESAVDYIALLKDSHDNNQATQILTDATKSLTEINDTVGLFELNKIYKSVYKNVA